LLPVVLRRVLFMYVKVKFFIIKKKKKGMRDDTSETLIPFVQGHTFQRYSKKGERNLHIIFFIPGCFSNPSSVSYH
jgi:hypothetical protein